ncbi:hypothetical protein BGZ60DRAFT_546624 [Tricladium varicosporioides]|nr:hypothetical protein BGZ60DRAFT_546624 [Hymenoscyphus varicosporioides]
MHLYILLGFITVIVDSAAVDLNHGNLIRWHDCSKSVPKGTGSTSFNESMVDLTNLPSTLHCGTIDVPMDYSHPLSTNNTITLGLAMYRPECPKGAIFFNPGGTDPGVVVAWEVALNLTDMFSGLLDHDLLMIDVRGTYSSNPLNVSLQTLDSFFGPYPTTKVEFDAIKSASTAAIQSWIDNSSPPGIIEHVGTREVVQDYELVRQALGYERIHFLGDSHGSFRAAQYAATFPDHAGNFALDAIVPHGENFYDRAQDSIRVLNLEVFRIDAFCQNTPSCPFRKDGRGGVLTAFRKVLSLADKGELLIPSCVNNTECTAAVSPLDVRTGIQGSLLGVPDFSAIIDGLNKSLTGDGSFFASGPPNIQLAWAMPLLCNDYGVYQNDQTGVGLSLIWQLQLMCSSWPFPIPTQTRLQLPQKMLLVAADFDASTPVEWMSFVRETAPNSGLVVRHGDGHVSFQFVDQPSTNITKDFLRTGILPSARNDTQVTVYAPGVKFVGVEDPYLVPT